MDEKTRLIRLKVENVMGIEAVEIRPDPDEPVVEIAGLNGAGKSSATNAVWFALGGAGALPGVPLRDGEDKGEITLDLGSVVVRRRITAKGTTLAVTNKDKSKPAHPQALLKKLLDGRSVDPLAFDRASPKDQLEQLRKIAGIDTTAIDARYAEKYHERTDVGRTARVALERAQGVDVPDDAPDSEVAISDILAELEQARRGAAEFDQLVRGEKESIDLVARLEADIARLNVELTHRKEILSKVGKDLGNLVRPDVAAVVARASKAEGRNRAFRMRQERERHMNEHERAARCAQQLTDELRGVEAQKYKLLADADYPVPGLGVTDNNVTWNGIPLAQASTAERMRVTTAMAMAGDPELKLLVISDGSLLDPESRAAVRAEAEARGYQVMLEIVAEQAGPGGFTIRDGRLVSDEELETVAARDASGVEPMDMTHDGDAPGVKTTWSVYERPGEGDTK